jgi:hypothetical protein
VPVLPFREKRADYGELTLGLTGRICAVDYGRGLSMLDVLEGEGWRLQVRHK